MISGGLAAACMRIPIAGQSGVTYAPLVTGIPDHPLVMDPEDRIRGAFLSLTRDWILWKK
jgi:hypothetical protein